MERHKACDGPPKGLQPEELNVLTFLKECLRSEAK
jgi:hypothetical protein